MFQLSKSIEKENIQMKRKMSEFIKTFFSLVTYDKVSLFSSMLHGSLCYKVPVSDTWQLDKIWILDDSF